MFSRGVFFRYILYCIIRSVVDSRVVSVLDSGAEGNSCRVTALGKLFTPIVPLFTKQRNW